MKTRKAMKLLPKSAASRALGMYSTGMWWVNTSRCRSQPLDTSQPMTRLVSSSQKDS